MRPLFRLMRIPNCLMMSLAVVVGSSIVGGVKILANITSQLVMGALAGFFLTASSMALNDYIDRDIDAINDPTKPIPSGAVSPQEALIVALVTLLTGLLLSWMIRITCFIIALGSWLIATLYSLKGKRTGLIGNLMVSACVVAPFVYGGYIIDNPGIELITFTSMVFLSNTAREITKGIVDVPGDRAHGIRTLAVVYGERKASYVAAMFYISAVLLSIVPPILGIVSYLYMIAVMIADLGFIHSTIRLLRNPSRENALKVKHEVLLWMLIGLLAFLLGKLT